MKKTLLNLMIVLLFLGTVPAFSYIIDGNLDDWGVTPFTDWVPDSPTADFNEEDNINHPWPQPVGEPWTDTFKEKYDIEAMYFDDDADWIYFGLVSSNPYKSDWASEDMAIDVDGDGVNEYGLDLANLNPRTDNGAPIQKGVYSVNSWYNYRNADYRIKSGTQIGTYEIFNRYLGAVEPYYQVSGWSPHTYILEGRINKLLFGSLACGQGIRLFFTRITCLKDYIYLSGTCNGNCGNGVIPEPATLLLVGGGLFGLSSLRGRKRR